MDVLHRGTGAFAALCCALVLPLSAGAAAVTVDGDLADLIAASANPDTGASGTESGFDAEGNGFDITNYYAFFSIPDDAFYFGFETQGPVGDSCSPTGGGLCFLGDPNLNFDAQESVGVQLDLTIDAVNPNWNGTDAGVILVGDGGAGTGPDSATTLTEPAGVTVSWAVSEANNGIEFGITGLMATGLIPNDFGPANPFDYAVRFSGGGATNPGPEDETILAGQLVPLPAAVWLFGSGLLGLLAAARRSREAG